MRGVPTGSPRTQHTFAAAGSGCAVRARPVCSTLITKVRRAKTAAEERAIIKKESAYIRTVLGSEPSRHAKRNLVKLMYMRMLGYPSEFGQVPCLALITKGDYSAKVRPRLPQTTSSTRTPVPPLPAHTQECDGGDSPVAVLTCVTVLSHARLPGLAAVFRLCCAACLRCIRAS